MNDGELNGQNASSRLFAAATVKAALKARKEKGQIPLQAIKAELGLSGGKPARRGS